MYNIIQSSVIPKHVLWIQFGSVPKISDPRFVQIVKLVTKDIRLSSAIDSKSRSRLIISILEQYVLR